ncbi:MAG: nucleoside phosphorylase [Candidatus Omnitrophota bacterium]|jgi:nucleoside phosphorylase
MIGIICPSTFEFDHLNIVNQDADIDIICSGMGKVRAALACHHLVNRNTQLDYILLIGFAGALSPTLAIGDLIEPTNFIEQDYNAEPLESFPNRVKRAPFKKLHSEAKDAVMLTQDRFLTHNPYTDLASQPGYESIACDMESYAVAYCSQELKIPFSALKFISDNADSDADHDFLGNCERLAPKFNATVNEAIQTIQQRLVNKVS